MSRYMSSSVTLSQAGEASEAPAEAREAAAAHAAREGGHLLVDGEDPWVATGAATIALEVTDGISFSKGLAEPDEPALSNRTLDGQLRAWVEIGTPSADRLNKISGVTESKASLLTLGISNTY